jgi:protein TonB
VLASSRPRVAARWGASLLFVLLAHGVVAAAILLHLDWSEPPRLPPESAMTVELAPLPTAPLLPPTRTPAGPPHVESSPAIRFAPRVMPRLPAPQPELSPIETPLEPPPDTKAAAEVALRSDRAASNPDPRKLTPAPVTTLPPTTQAAPDKKLQAQSMGAAANTPSTAEQTWEARVSARLERYKRYPEAAQLRRETDVVYLGFTMDRSGHVLSSHIEHSAGYTLLDAEVNTLVQRASPLPPPPKEVTGDQIDLVVPVEFFLRK